MRDGHARKLIREDLGETLFVEAGAGSGKTTSLVERVVSIVLREGMPLCQVAAVTFTEKAAAELRERLRAAFAQHPGEASARALADLDTAAIGTLHAFAQRLLTEHPIEAGLPPLLEVQDEVASGVTADARWLTLRAELLDDPDVTDTLLLAMAAGVKIEHLRSLTYVLNASWDLIASRVLPVPVPDLPPIDVAGLAAEARRLAALAGGCRSDTDKLLPALAKLAGWASQLDDAPHDAARLGVLGGAVANGWHLGRAENWPAYPVARLRAECRAVTEAAADLRQRILEVTLRRLARRLGHAVLQDASVRRAEGRLEFHDLLVLARDLLRSPVRGAEVRACLQRRYRRLLLDEFQDTDPIQIELAVRIAGGAAAVAGDWADVDIPDGSLFVVGDPKQSIYRFRRADIGMYLRARQTLGREVVLDTNFRSTAPIVEWINSVFGRLMVASPDSQPAYRPLAAHRTEPAPRGPAVCTLGATAHSDSPNATELREREAADVIAAVRTALAERWQVAGDGGWRDIELRDICILVPARTSLPQLENALDAAGIGYHPGATSLVYRSREVRDLLTAARAADDPSDELALVTAMRSPLFGCGDDDLWTWRSAGGRLNVFSSAPVPPAHPVAVAIEYLRALHHERDWQAPSEVLTRLVTERRIFEQAVGAPRTRDVWRRLRFVVDQARAWSDTSHGGLREYLAWATRQGSDTARVAEAALPETDTDTLKIMTMHSAKGLEFPMVIVSGLTTRLVRPASGLQLLWPRTGGYALKLHSRAKTADFDAAHPIDEQMSADEKLRLLYVACTRARDHLVVSLHRKGNGSATSAELIAGVAGDVPSLRAVDRDVDLPVPPAVTPPPSLGRWTADITATRASAARPAAASASGFEGALPSVSDPGLVKGPRDLELAPWHKGRYGTAIGRAVHGVLQSVDLATAAGLADAVAAQALAEGVVPHAALVRELADSALAAPLIRRAATRPHWRESYAATVVGSRVLEGMIDLLYRDDDGLVIVDYKTDAVPFSALAARVDFYRPQMAAYAAAVAAATGEPAPRCVLLFLSPTGAEAWEVPELPAAMTAVRAAMVT
jgi:ATP-dependent helicase/nuclease subunit A